MSKLINKKKKRKKKKIFFLHRLIKKNRFQGFSLQLVRKFAHSILQCLDALYRNKIIHCGKKKNLFE
jgi:hypothetical protein